MWHQCSLKGTHNPKDKNIIKPLIKQCALYHMPSFLYVHLIMYKCLRGITEPVWRLTFWVFHLWQCDVRRPLPPTPRLVKTKETPSTEAQNAHRPKAGRRLFTLLNQQNDHLQPPNFSLDYKVQSLTLPHRI